MSSDLDGLSPRQKEVIFWSAEGKTDREIGQILNMSHRTVRFHRDEIKRKLGFKSTIQCAVFLARKGLL